MSNKHLDWIIERREQLRGVADGDYDEVDAWVLALYVDMTLGEISYCTRLPVSLITYLVIRATARLMIQEWHTPREGERL